MSPWLIPAWEARAALACEAGEHFFVAPDNGLLDFCLDLPDLQAVRLTKKEFWREAIAVTFHGRDIFAPVAAHLAKGEAVRHFGEPFTLHKRLPVFECRIADKALRGQVVYSDRFGNLISNISAPRLHEFAQGQPITIWLAEHLIGGLCQTYADVPPHSPLALIGSFGFLEIGLNRGSAQTRFSARLGALVTVRRGQLI